MKNAFLFLVLTFFSSSVFSLEACFSLNVPGQYCSVGYQCEYGSQVYSAVYGAGSSSFRYIATCSAYCAAGYSNACEAPSPPLYKSDLDSVFTFFILASCFGFFIAGWSVGGKH